MALARAGTELLCAYVIWQGCSNIALERRSNRKPDARDEAFIRVQGRQSKA